MRGITLSLLLITAVPTSAAPGGDLVTLYTDLHTNPELAFAETRSAAILAAEARAAGFSVTEKVGKTGVVAMLVNGPGPVLLIRTDMDALPVPEATGLPYASKIPNTMHACGHDIHMAGWVGTARWMAANKAKWSGTLMMIAQPAEEIVGGAKAMLDDGLYAKFARPTHALAFHDSASLPAGQVGITDGYALANVDSIDLTVRGIGSHGSEPQNGIDPIVIAARIVGTLQTLISRENDPRQPAVITVGSFHAGSKHNIIGDEAKLLITVRSYDPKVRARLLDGIRRVAKAEAEAAGVPEALLPIVTTSQPSASTFNTPKLTATVTTALETALGKDRVVRIAASMAAEDFGAFSRDQPIESTIFWVGAQPKSVWDAAGGDIRKLPGLHSAKFAPDPAPTIRTAVEAMTAAAMSVVGK
ncbi:amidohydrolase [Glacieibacterium frigidum]|uniref:Amidohydrolase n=1 Tax=Glacieibacterium frigidum TaxID=2593303 RepID=A0A552U7N4_9SPHN|nr:amidohydrolase [Glacieibacterium frigidum]